MSMTKVLEFGKKNRNSSFALIKLIYFILFEFKINPIMKEEWACRQSKKLFSWNVIEKCLITLILNKIKFGH